METEEEKKKNAFYLAMIGDRSDGLTSANSAEFMADILGAATPQDSVTVGCPPPATRQAQDQAETSGEPVAVVEPQVRSHAHRRATDYGKWDAFVDDDSNRMASEPRDDRNASAKVQPVRSTGNVLISAPP